VVHSWRVERGFIVGEFMGGSKLEETRVHWRKPRICHKLLTEETTDLPQVTDRKPQICHKLLTEETTDLPQVTDRGNHGSATSY
jgi:hypothetical protein